MSIAGDHDLRHRAGDTLEQGLIISTMDPVTKQATPAVLTGWVPSATLRSARTWAPVEGLSASLANQTTDPGVVTLQATAEATAAWVPGPSLLYDLYLTETATGFVRTVLEGRIVVERG